MLRKKRGAEFARNRRDKTKSLGAKRKLRAIKKMTVEASAQLEFEQRQEGTADLSDRPPTHIELDDKF